MKKELIKDILADPKEMKYWEVSSAQNESIRNSKLRDAANIRFKAQHKNKLPLHEVCLDPFFMGKYEVTQEQFMKIMKTNPSKAIGNSSHPVELVSWDQAVQFTQLLSKSSQYSFRLPTEAEWEYAARGATTTVRYFGDSITCKDALFSNRKGDTDTCGETLKRMKIVTDSTAPGGLYPANPYGLHDMLGNVSEWCLDGYHSDMYSTSEKMNPLGEDARYHVYRGGSWRDKAEYLRSASRDFLEQDVKGTMIGFRVVLPKHCIRKRVV